MQSLKDKEVSPEDLFKPEKDEKKEADLAAKFSDFEEIPEEDKKEEKKVADKK